MPEKNENKNDTLMIDILEKYLNNSEIKKVGIGMGSTMLKLSKILPDSFLYFSASNQTELFLKGKIISSVQNFEKIDIYFDSADFYDLDGNLIKGGGGALTNEKLLMKMAKKSIIIVQRNKFVKNFNNLKIPIEILKNSYGYFLDILKNNNIKGTLRLINKLSPFITDNGNYIVDVDFNIEFIKKCKDITGVIEHGYFTKDLSYEIIELH